MKNHQTVQPPPAELLPPLRRGTMVLKEPPVLMERLQQKGLELHHQLHHQHLPSLQHHGPPQQWALIQWHLEWQPPKHTWNLLQRGGLPNMLQTTLRQLTTMTEKAVCLTFQCDKHCRAMPTTELNLPPRIAATTLLLGIVLGFPPVVAKITGLRVISNGGRPAPC